jgi:hypothetical protein
MCWGCLLHGARIRAELFCCCSVEEAQDREQCIVGRLYSPDLEDQTVFLIDLYSFGVSMT